MDADLSFLLSAGQARHHPPAPMAFEQALQAAARAAENLAGVLRSPRTGRLGLPPEDPERVRLEQLHREACALAAELYPYEPKAKAAVAPVPVALAPTVVSAVGVDPDPADAVEAARRRAARTARKKHLPNGP